MNGSVPHCLICNLGIVITTRKTAGGLHKIMRVKCMGCCLWTHISCLFLDIFQVFIVWIHSRDPDRVWTRVQGKSEVFQNFSALPKTNPSKNWGPKNLLPWDSQIAIGKEKRFPSCFLEKGGIIKACYWQNLNYTEALPEPSFRVAPTWGERGDRLKFQGPNSTPWQAHTLGSLPCRTGETGFHL